MTRYHLKRDKDLYCKRLILRFQICLTISEFTKRFLYCLKTCERLSVISIPLSLIDVYPRLWLCHYIIYTM